MCGCKNAHYFCHSERSEESLLGLAIMWRALQPAGFGPCKPETTQAEARATEMRKEREIPRSAQNDKSKCLFHVWSTPVLNSFTSGFNAAASSAQINASRVCAGSIMASTHNRAAA